MKFLKEGVFVAIVLSGIYPSVIIFLDIKPLCCQLYENEWVKKHNYRGGIKN